MYTCSILFNNTIVGNNNFSILLF